MNGCAPYGKCQPDPALAPDRGRRLYAAFLFGRATKPASPQERERRRLVEEEEIETAVSGLSASKWAEIDRLLSDRKKIDAIKVLREATGLGLKLSKMAVERRRRP